MNEIDDFRRFQEQQSQTATNGPSVADLAAKLTTAHVRISTLERDLSKEWMERRIAEGRAKGWRTESERVERELGRLRFRDRISPVVWLVVGVIVGAVIVWTLGGAR